MTTTFVDQDNGITKFDKEFKLYNNKFTRTSNMYLFNHMKQIKKYTIFDILKEYCKIRIYYYKKRKEYLLNKLQSELLYIDAKIKFILEIIHKTLIISNRKKIELENELKTKKYPMKKNGDKKSYDYLISMPLYNLTYEKKEELLKNQKNLQDMFDKISQMTCIKMWKQDLREFLKSYNSYKNVD